MTITTPHQETLPEPFGGYLRQFDYIGNDTESLVSGLSDARFNWRPGPGQWSVGDCLGHLMITGQGATKVVDRMISQAKAQNLLGSGPYRRNLLGNWFIQLVEPPYRLRVKTFRSMEPVPDQPLAQLVPAFLELQEQLKDLIRQANGLDLGAVSAKAPVGINLTLGQWFEFVAAHQRRHLWQARNVRNNPAFPKQ